jgi:hypothetical protein
MIEQEITVAIERQGLVKVSTVRVVVTNVPTIQEAVAPLPSRCTADVPRRTWTSITAHNTSQGQVHSHPNCEGHMQT